MSVFCCLLLQTKELAQVWVHSVTDQIKKVPLMRLFLPDVNKPTQKTHKSEAIFLYPTLRFPDLHLTFTDKMAPTLMFCFSDEVFSQDFQGEIGSLKSLQMRTLLQSPESNGKVKVHYFLKVCAHGHFSGRFGQFPLH